MSKHRSAHGFDCWLQQTIVPEMNVIQRIVGLSLQLLVILWNALVLDKTGFARQEHAKRSIIFSGVLLRKSRRLSEVVKSSPFNLKPYVFTNHSSMTIRIQASFSLLDFCGTARRIRYMRNSSSRRFTHCWDTCLSLLLISADVPNIVKLSRATGSAVALKIRKEGSHLRCGNYPCLLPGSQPH